MEAGTVVCEVLFLPSYPAYPRVFSCLLVLISCHSCRSSCRLCLRGRKGLLGGRKDAGGSAQPPLLSKISCSPPSLAKELIYYKWAFCFQEELPSCIISPLGLLCPTLLEGGCFSSSQEGACELGPTGSPKQLPDLLVPLPYLLCRLGAWPSLN